MADEARGYWVLADANLAAMLRRVAGPDGEDVELVMVEEYANCDHDHIVRKPPPKHDITVIHRSTPPNRDAAWVQFVCSVDSCVAGTLEVSPARALDAVLTRMQANYDHDGPGR